jgi:glutaredoxin 3
MNVEIYSTPSCGNCNIAKNLLKAKGINFSEYSVGVDVQKSEIESRVGGPVRSVPVVFIDDRFVGGLQELRASIA